MRAIYFDTEAARKKMRAHAEAAAQEAMVNARTVRDRDLIRTLRAFEDAAIEFSVAIMRLSNQGVPTSTIFRAAGLRLTSLTMSVGTSAQTAGPDAEQAFEGAMFTDMPSRSVKINPVTGGRQ